MIAPIGEDLRAKVQFVYTNTHAKYDALRLTIINRHEGTVDSETFKFKDTMSHGRCLTARISESRIKGDGCILSDILISDVPEKYYLNQKQMEQLLFKSGQEVRGKESTVPKD